VPARLLAWEGHQDKLLLAACGARGGVLMGSVRHRATHIQGGEYSLG
jgi:hypothetical protein